MLHERNEPFVRKPKVEINIDSRFGEDSKEGDTGKDSGNESAEAESDSEDRKESLDELKNELVGMNVSINFHNIRNISKSVIIKAISWSMMNNNSIKFIDRR